MAHSGAGTIPPSKSPLEKNDDVKTLFSIGCPVILVTLGVALLFIIRKKRKEKRLKRLRGERRRREETRYIFTYQTKHMYLNIHYKQGCVVSQELILDVLCSV